MSDVWRKVIGQRTATNESDNESEDSFVSCNEEASPDLIISPIISPIKESHSNKPSIDDKIVHNRTGHVISRPVHTPPPILSSTRLFSTPHTSTQLPTSFSFTTTSNNTTKSLRSVSRYSLNESVREEGKTLKTQRENPPERIPPTGTK